MNRLLTGLATFALLASVVVFAVPEEASAQSGGVGFGMDSGSIQRQTNAGVKPDYGVMWIGPWTLSSGWGGPNAQMDAMRAAGVTPTIHFYYWGDDISKSCLSNGCWSSLHNTWKDQAGWNKLAKQLNDNVNARMGGAKVIIIVETEFNKADLQTYKPLDYQLRDKVNYFKWNTRNAEVGIGLGTWNTGSWTTWSASGKASHFIGIQGMRGSTHEKGAAYTNLYDVTLAGAKTAKATFGKPILIMDIALSSYPEPQYLSHQSNTLKQFFTGLPALKAEGVTGLIYRTWLDQPDKNLGNYYGIAERHWGFAYASNGAWKPAASVWVDGVKAARSGSSGGSGGGSGGGTGSYAATFQPSGSINNWWVDVDVRSNPNAHRVAVKVNDGSWTALQKSDWGTWARSMHVPTGADVTFRATDASGNHAFSSVYKWLQSGSRDSTSSVGTYTATFTTSGSVNEWWVDVNVKASPAPTRVAVKVNDGSWTALQKTDWGTWARSMHIAKGSDVVFRATDASGNHAFSSKMAWLGGSGGGGGGSTTYKASFATPSSVNEWWVDVNVKASPAPTRVAVKVNDGSWTALQKTDWGTWARSMHVPKGAEVTFRATDSAGNHAFSEKTTWLGPSFSASFSPVTQNNRWWVETSVRGNEPVTKVEYRVNGGSWSNLPKADWGNHATGTQLQSGSNVEFRAFNSAGQSSMSGTYRWG